MRINPLSTLGTSTRILSGSKTRRPLSSLLAYSSISSSLYWSSILDLKHLPQRDERYLSTMPPKKKYTDPKLRDEVKEEVQQGDKGGAPGQWSARKV